MNRITTRCEMLDRRLGGGIPRGSIVSLVSSPTCNCGPLFSGLLENRSWMYVTTYRSRTAVREEFDDLLWGDFSVEDAGVDRPIKNTYAAMEGVAGEPHVIVDTMNALETTGRTGEYTRLLNGLKEYLVETDSIAVLHCTEYGSPPPLRETTLTVSDVVMELEIVEEGSEMKTLLKVPKYRGMRTADEIIKLRLDGDVSVDTSKNIA